MIVSELLRRGKRQLGALALTSGVGCLRAIGVRPPSALLILGHMRSGSTLLLHLLLTNKAIASLGERNATYDTPDDLRRLAALARLQRGTVFTPLGYAADQVNHSRLTPNPGLFGHARLRTIFLLRNPVDSLASLMELSRTYYGQSWTITGALDYYLARLQFMAEVGHRLVGTGHAVFVTYEQLTESTAPTLARLQQFLGLSDGFSVVYSRQHFTGIRGDPGPKISLGRVIPAVCGETSRLPADVVERATQAYTLCREVLDQLNSHANNRAFVA